MTESTTATFFSYSRKDAKFALQLARDLRTCGALVWLDQLDIEPGDRWDAAVESALARCPRVLVVLSPSSTASQNVMDEISYALDEGKPVIPILYEDCKVPFRLRRLQYADFRNDYQSGLARLIDVLNAHAKPVETLEVDGAVAPGMARDDSGWKRWLLLTPRKSTGGKIFRVAFYVLVVVSALHTLGIFLNDAGQLDSKAPFHHLGGVIGGNVLLVFLLGVCWCLAQVGMSRGDSRWERWLLLPPLKSTGGKIFRAAFYILLFVGAFYTLDIVLNDAGDFDLGAPFRHLGEVVCAYALQVVLLATCWFLARKASDDEHATPKDEKNNGARSAG